MPINIKMNMKYYPAKDSGDMNYAVFYPDNYEDLPLVIFLHGAGERGLKYKHVFRHGIPKLLAQGKEFPAIILVPQCPEKYVWDNVVADVKKIIDSVVEEFSIKPDRISITGGSMGGYGTFMMGMTYTNFFSGIAPVAGGGMPWRVGNLRTTPIYAIHGEKDDTVYPACTELVQSYIFRRPSSARRGSIRPNATFRSGQT